MAEFSSDAPLFYNVPGQAIWAERGYAVPNYGPYRTDAGLGYTVNDTLEEFTTEAGKRLSMIMHHPDVNRADPPSVNTVVRMIQLLNRSRVVLLGRAIAENQPKFESTKLVSSRKPMKVFPFPFFRVHNRLMQTFAETACACLAELFQSTENTVPWDITMALAVRATSYVQRFQVRLAMDYFGMSKEQASAPDLDLSTSANLALYTPVANGFVGAETIDPIDTLSWPQEVDLGILATGILIIDLPKLGPYPYEDAAAAKSGGSVTGQASGSSSLPPFPTNTTFGV